jgi:hypothetical protein
MLEFEETDLFEMEKVSKIFNKKMRGNVMSD